MFIRLQRIFTSLLLIVTAALPAVAQSESKVSVDVNETLFTILTAMNACGFDQELAQSDPVRRAVREEIAYVFRTNQAAAATQQAMCRYYKDKQEPDPARNLAQFVSLALNLDAPPEFKFKIREADLPPDAANVSGFVPYLQRFYAAAGVGQIWRKHQGDYEQYVSKLQEPLAGLILRTDAYLRLPISGYVGRKLVIYVDPMGVPGQVNARNYADDYSMVVAPVGTRVPVEQIRHTYLHFVLDPFTLKRSNAIKRVDPLLNYISSAPLDPSYKSDAGLLIIESLIRAIEMRNAPGKTEEQKAALVQPSVEEGFTLTRYFFNALRDFEKSETGLKDAFSDMLYGIDMGRETRIARETVFRAQAAPEVVRASRPSASRALDLAEERLATNDTTAAARLARNVLDEGGPEQARALFILARAATLQGDMNAAQLYFERTISITKDARQKAWSHIYLGRIHDLMAQNSDGSTDPLQRDKAMVHYRTALAAGEAGQDTAAAAQRGIEKPYEPSRAQRNP